MDDDGVSEVPTDLEIHWEPRRPETDPTVGIAVDAGPASARPPRHRLVTMGDSISHGFMSGAVFRTEVSWPAIVAYELGLRLAPPTADPAPPDVFRYPVYEPPDGPGGLPVDVERLLRGLQTRYGAHVSITELFKAAWFANRFLDGVEDFWEREADERVPMLRATPHNLAVYGWDVRDLLSTSYDAMAKTLADHPAKDNALPWQQIVENDTARAGLRVLGPAHAEYGTQTAVEAATALGADGGIETLVVMIGANNALASMLKLNLCWSGDDYADCTQKAKYTVWRPTHFANEWAELVTRVRTIDARHVIVATVPSVTIAPIAQGLPAKLAHGSRYFPYYTRPWIDASAFEPRYDTHITGDDARAVDSAIDAYNATIIDSVRAARTDGLDWYVFELGGLLDSLASKRYLTDPAARPPWWREYQLPAAIKALDPVPNTRFFRSGMQGRTDGGLFSLDGVHPTTIGYGVVAQEVIRIMERAGVTFRTPTGDSRPGTIDVDWRRLLATDTLMTSPPALLDGGLGLLGWFDERLDWVRRLSGR
jgi:hypothetical protein